MTQTLLVVTTVAGADDAHRLAHTLVDRRLAACVQISAIHSVYRWHGVVEQGAECRLLCKTSADMAPALIAALRELHPYALPAIHTLEPAWADTAYAEWIAQSTRPPPA